VPTRILFVEDDDAIRETTRIALEDEDYVVDEASTGGEALPAFARQPVDCVLLDLMLPDETGFEVCRSLRQRSTGPIIMVTARRDTFDVVGGLEPELRLRHQAVPVEGARRSHMGAPSAGARDGNAVAGHTAR
jgi:DNA-binding response OmpR family regulator